MPNFQDWDPTEVHIIVSSATGEHLVTWPLIYAVEAGKCSLAGQPCAQPQICYSDGGWRGGGLVLADGSGMPTLYCACQFLCWRILSFLSFGLPEVPSSEDPILWLAVLGGGSRKTSKHALCRPSHPRTSGEEPLKKRGARSSCSSQCAPFTPFLCTIHFILRLPGFIPMVPSWHWDLTMLVLGTYTDRLCIRFISEEHILAESLSLDLLDSSDHVYLQLWWMNQSCFKIQMCFRNKNSRSSKTVPIVGTTYWSLEHTVLFWNLL